MIGELVGMVSEILADESDKMSAWKIKFIDDMDRRLDRGVNLSPRQTKKIEALWQKLFA